MTTVKFILLWLDPVTNDGLINFSHVEFPYAIAKLNKKSSVLQSKYIKWTCVRNRFLRQTKFKPRKQKYYFSVFKNYHLQILKLINKAKFK